MEYEENKHREIELRSGEVQEIMSEIPPWILRHGLTTLSIIVLLLLIGSYFFKYPDTITAEITVTSSEPPVSIIARSTGKIDRVFVKNNQKVTVGSPLAVIQNAADTQDMFTLIKMMSMWRQSSYQKKIGKEVPQNLSLGPIQSAYASFLSSLNDYQNYKSLEYYQKKIASQKQQLSIQKEYHDRIIKQVAVANEEFVIANRVFERDSFLTRNKIISDDEYDMSKNRLLQNEQSYLSLKASLKQSELQLVKNQESLLELEQKAMELERMYKLSLQNAVEVLNAQVKSWEQDFLLSSPIDGTITQMGIWSSNQNVCAGETVFVVIPSQQHSSTGRAMLPVRGAGKVKVNQCVNVRINNFPDMEFGYLPGKVKSISNIPTTDGFYVVEVTFPNGMQTNYGKILPITQQMLGNADFITDDLRLIERFFMPIKKLLKKQIWLYN